MQTRIIKLLLSCGCALLASCAIITVNVYFPEKAVKDAYKSVDEMLLKGSGDKPATGLQEAARTARYRLLGRAAAAAGATHILTAHTRDDQAETVLFRLARGSGLTGLA
ncbi:MAG: hypothetical protein HZC44_03765, partial [Geobacter sp.]|nr:hypothetical protein [Geobacter sp.]